jgi:poly-gamma-glutamate synthase PgsB/CapB
MSEERRKLDLLLEQMAKAEVSRAKEALAGGGVVAVVALGRETLTSVVAARARFDALTAAIERAPVDRTALIEGYLRASVRDEASLRGDLRALRERAGAVLDVPALTERVAREATDGEILVEVCMALARRSLDASNARDVDANVVAEIAWTPGRWSRRVEALRLLREVARYEPDAATRRVIRAAAHELAQPDEHRWVQPAAIAALAAVDAPKAIAMARERLERPRPGDDLLVRERIVDLAARLRRAPWHELVAIAARDPSDHVRITAARAAQDPALLGQMARADASPKVRAAAAIHLTKRIGGRVEPLLFDLLRTDASGIVANTAAEMISLLARRQRLRSRDAAFEALRAAAARADLPPDVRARIAEEIAEIDVALDPYLAMLREVIGRIVERVPVGSAARLAGPGVANVTDEQLGRVLTVLSRGDFALSADRASAGLVLYRGETRAFAPWRALFELRNPLPSKRQGYFHSWGRRPRGRLRAPPAGLAEITATRVPGERVLASKAGGWGRELPLVDDLLSLGVLRRRPVALIGAGGTTILTPPPSIVRRALAWGRVTLAYARLAELRRRALDSGEESVQRAFVDEVTRLTGIALRYEPRAFGAGRVALAPPAQLSTSASPLAPPSAFAIAPFGFAGVTGRDFASYSLSAQGNRLPHVAAFASLILVAMIVRGVLVRRGIDRDRKAIPLVLGGWGTRGKSGTERIKAGLLQGMGYECLVKTTGCEAMFIHALPDVPAREVFIYRAYDKATVWEQRDLLTLGRRFGVRAFLWECMALQPDLVNLLQAQWMRDDYSTITNAYPDHEDVQGPAGFDVAEVISEFVPTRGRLFTAEDQMLPILRERAKERRTSIHVAGARHADLIADDLLARFPYHEHPRNIALVAQLAQALGIPASIAIAEMADNVVPDLGVLKTYPRVMHEGRTLEFTNGMSANERTGALSNWTRMAFDRHDPDASPATWIVTVVNNRADRVARSEVFARFIVEDIAAHRHVLIGTNVSGLVGFIEEALARHLLAISPTDKLAGDAEERRRAARARVERALAALHVPRTDAASVEAELAALRLPALVRDRLEALLVPASPAESYADARRAIDAAMPADFPSEARPFLVAQIARRRTARALLAAVDAHVPSAPEALERAFRDAYRAMFEEQIVPLHDATLTGDQVIDRVARAVPPGAHAAIMGIQNIKGTGLDFVYRWVSLDVVDRALRRVEEGSPEEVARGLRELRAHDDYGLVDARDAIRRLRGARDRAQGDLAAYDAILHRLDAIEARRAAGLTATRVDTWSDKARRFVGKTFDYLDSIRRQRMARQVVDDLVAARISHSAAAIAMRDVVARAKGAWMMRRG